MFLGCNFPKIIQRKTNKRLDRKGVKELTLTTVSDSIHYYEGGTGETVMLLHGFGGDAQLTWKDSLYHLSKNYNVIAPDLLWFGKSYSSSVPNLDAQVEALAKLIRTKKRNKLTLIGISYGGFVAMALAYKYPELVQKMVMVNSPGITYDIHLLENLCAKMKVDSVDKIFVPKSYKEVNRLLKLAFYKPQHLPRRIMQDIYDLYFSENHSELTSAINTLKLEQSTFQNATASDFPKSLVIWGKEDAVFPMSEGRKLASFLNAEFELIQGAGHAVNIEKYAEFEQLIDRFIAK